MRLVRLALLPAVFFLSAVSFVGAGEDGEVIEAGHVSERAIGGGEAYTFHAEVQDAALLVRVEQRGIDLVVEVQGTDSRWASDLGDSRWGPEVLLLEGPGKHRIEIRAKERFVASARYTLAVEALPAATPEEEQRRAAFSLMSRAGREAFLRDAEARRRGVALFREALTAWRTLADRRREADTRYAIAFQEKDLAELQSAAAEYLQASALWRELDEPQLEAASLNWLGVVRFQVGEINKAQEALEGALSLWQRHGGRFDEAVTRSNLCSLEQRRDALPEAFACYEETLAIFRELGCRKDEARILTNVAAVNDVLGEPDAALERYRQALDLRRQLADRRGEAEILNNMATVHRALGEWQEALHLYNQVGEILSVLGDRTLEAARLNNVGFAYNSLGEPQRAASLLADALKLRQETGDRRGEIITLNNLGSVFRNLGELDQAIAHHQRALELAKALPDQRQEAITRLRLAEVQLERGQAAAALREIEPLLASMRASGNRRGEATAVQLQGRALARAGRPREALPVFQDVLTRYRTLRDGAGEAETLQALASAERSLGFADAARGHAEEAIARVEELRTGFVSPNLRAAFLATQRRAYSLKIDLLMDRHEREPGKGFDLEAVEVSERARARSLLDVLSSGTVARTGDAAPRELLERRQVLRRRLSSLAYQQLQQSGAKADALGREMERLLVGLDSAEAEIRRLDPLYAAVSAPPALGVEEIARLLDSGTLLLEYSLGEERSYLWAVGSGSFRSFVLPPQREIEEKARHLYEELSTLEAGAGARRDTAEELSRILLQPAWSEVAKAQRLVVVPDGALHLIPFSALPAPGSGERLLDRLEIAYLPSATTLAFQRKRLEHRPPATKWAAVLADPVFKADDPRLASQSGTGRLAADAVLERSTPEAAPLADLERLPATRDEAEKIVDLAPTGQVWTALNLDASRETVLSKGLRGYQVVHFATHGLADARNPELSGLVLSLVDAAGRPREGFLSLTDIYDLDLDAGLAVLSGCRTALGKEVRGEGVMGLTRGFLYAGVPRVVASLWKVQDRTTAELMAHFYRALWEDRLTPAAALREAQRSLRRNRRYGDPYFWAGFVLQGDWR